MVLILLLTVKFVKRKTPAKSSFIVDTNEIKKEMVAANSINQIVLESDPEQRFVVHTALMRPVQVGNIN